jgi:Icc-related predicted phosphoesterase
MNPLKSILSIFHFLKLKFIICFLLAISFVSFSQNTAKQKISNIVFGFVSDTQGPNIYEKWFIGANRNEEATDAIFSNILKEKGLKALFHLGDITSFGSFNSAWSEFDKQSLKFHQAHIPIYPAMGNHDYYLYKKPAIEQFIKRFPDIKNSWYTVSIDSIAVIILNSNYSRLSSEQINSQKEWYSRSLSELQRKPSIKAIIVGIHHPPYTNSKVTNPSVKVQNDFIPLFIKTKKCKLFLSGHAHTFEHFRNGGKDFLVIGGGGGVQHPLLLGSEQRWTDISPFHTEIRGFHYLLCEQKNDTLNAAVIMLNSDFKTFNKVYEIKISIKN